MCEGHGFTRERAGSQYAQATTDLEVDSAPDVRRLVLSRGLMPAVRAAMLASHGVAPVALDDLFVVRYDAEEQRDLVRHVDAGDVSFMLALSDRAAYSGGGTAFDVMETDVVHLERGELVLFDAALYHAGISISRGKRYLLVGFCHTDSAALCVPGNLNLRLAPITCASGRTSNHDGAGAGAGAGGHAGAALGCTASGGSNESAHGIKRCREETSAAELQSDKK